MTGNIYFRVDAVGDGTAVVGGEDEGEGDGEGKPVTLINAGSEGV